jgi:hypothetical protein
MPLSLKGLSRDQILAVIRQSTDLKNLDASGLDLRGIDFREKNLADARFRYADLTGATFRGANLAGANLRHARLVGCDFRNADLTGADLSHADLHGAIFGDTRTTGMKAYHTLGVRKDVVFFPLSTLQELARITGVKMGDELLEISGNPGEQFRLVQAVRILETIPPSPRTDPPIGQILTLPEIRSRQGVLSGEKLILDGKKYRVEEGYLGRPISGIAQQYLEPSLAETQERSSDLKLLEEFLIRKL